MLGEARRCSEMLGETSIWGTCIPFLFPARKHFLEINHAPSSTITTHRDSSVNEKIQDKPGAPRGGAKRQGRSLAPSTSIPPISSAILPEILPQILSGILQAFLEIFLGNWGKNLETSFFGEYSQRFIDGFFKDSFEILLRFFQRFLQGFFRHFCGEYFQGCIELFSSDCFQDSMATGNACCNGHVLTPD